MSRLERARAKERLLVLGLISGTSADAAEAALCTVEGSGAQVRLSLVHHHSEPFEPGLRERVRSAQDPQALSELNVVLGERFAHAAEAALRAAGVPADELDVIGSHGQTVAHLPPPRPHPSTLQLGEPSVLAERLGVPIVYDFRARDVAAGGQGAPLVPYFDWAVLRGRGVTRAFLNLGGIANLSVVSERLEDTVAFDTGPGNMLLDGLALRLSKGAQAFDRDGALAAQGLVDPALLQQLLRHPYFSRPPPKSTGWEEFGETLLDELWTLGKARPHDLLATALELTVESCARAFEHFVLPRHPLEAVYVSGGGCRNPRLFTRLRQRLAPQKVEPLDVLGFPEGAKEAACFALLASECVRGVPQNVPSATGAAHAVVLGKIVP